MMSSSMRNGVLLMSAAASPIVSYVVVSTSWSVAARAIWRMFGCVQ